VPIPLPPNLAAHAARRQRTRDAIRFGSPQGGTPRRADPAPILAYQAAHGLPMPRPPYATPIDDRPLREVCRLERYRPTLPTPRPTPTTRPLPPCRCLPCRTIAAGFIPTVL
jgi:hypothetical protein